MFKIADTYLFTAYFVMIISRFFSTIDSIATSGKKYDTSRSPMTTSDKIPPMTLSHIDTYISKSFSLTKLYSGLEIIHLILTQNFPIKTYITKNC